MNSKLLFKLSHAAAIAGTLLTGVSLGGFLFLPCACSKKVFKSEEYKKQYKEQFNSIRSDESEDEESVKKALLLRDMIVNGQFKVSKIEADDAGNTFFSEIDAKDMKKYTTIRTADCEVQKYIETPGYLDGTGPLPLVERVYDEETGPKRNGSDEQESVETIVEESGYLTESEDTRYENCFDESKKIEAEMFDDEVDEWIEEEEADNSVATTSKIIEIKEYGGGIARYRRCPNGQLIKIEEPKIITEDAYMENEWGFDQDTLWYYEGDGRLTDDRDEVLVNKNYYIGDAYNHFGSGSSDENNVHVINYEEAKLFEVVREFSSYSEAILGIDPDVYNDIESE